jgi:hypothetical protein
MVMAASLMACGPQTHGQPSPPSEPDEPVAYDALVRVEQVGPNSRCAAGGQRIRRGLDRNRNAILEDREVAKEDFICAQKDGQAITAYLEEEPGDNCEFGGVTWSVGNDQNNSGVLDADETEITYFVCNPTERGAKGPKDTVLVRARADVLQQLLAAPQAIAATSAPHQELQMDVGMRILTDNPLLRFGLKVDDVIHVINSLQTTSAVELGSALTEASNTGGDLIIEATRGHEPIGIRIEASGP